MLALSLARGGRRQRVEQELERSRAGASDSLGNKGRTERLRAPQGQAPPRLPVCQSELLIESLARLSEAFAAQRRAVPPK